MKKSIVRIISLLLAIAAIVACSSCHPEEPVYDNTLHVTVTNEEIVYSQSFLEDAEESFATVAIALLEHYYDAPLDVYQISRVRAQFQLNILPMLYRIRIYQEELDTLLTALENNIQKEEIPSFALLLYNCALPILGAQRCGRLFFGASLITLSNKAEKAREKFAEYGYVWYQEEAERCDTIKNGLTAMGEERFCEAMSIFTSLATLGMGIQQSGNESAFLLDEASILYVIEYRTRVFLESHVGEDEWSLIGALLTEFIPARATTFTSSMNYELKKANYLTEATKAMPEVIAVYAALASALKALPDVSFDADSDEQACTLAKALLQSHTALEALSRSLTEHASIATDSQRTLITKTFGAQAFEGYTAISFEEWMAGIEDVANCGNGGADALYNLTISYLYGIAPYLTLAYLTDLG